MTDATGNVFEGGFPFVNGLTQIKKLLGTGTLCKTPAFSTTYEKQSAVTSKHNFFRMLHLFPDMSSDINQPHLSLTLKSVVIQY